MTLAEQRSVESSSIDSRRFAMCLSAPCRGAGHRGVQVVKWVGIIRGKPHLVVTHPGPTCGEMSWFVGGNQCRLAPVTPQRAVKRVGMVAAVKPWGMAYGVLRGDEMRESGLVRL
jgi:hypothetical protein